MKRLLKNFLLVNKHTHIFKLSNGTNFDTILLSDNALYHTDLLVLLDMIQQLTLQFHSKNETILVIYHICQDVLLPTKLTIFCGGHSSARTDSSQGHC